MPGLLLVGAIGRSNPPAPLLSGTKPLRVDFVLDGPVDTAPLPKSGFPPCK